jgi:hypothetical protein
MNAVMRSRVASSGCDVSELIIILVLPVSFGSTASVGLLGVRGPSCLVFWQRLLGSEREVLVVCEIQFWNSTK